MKKKVKIKGLKSKVKIIREIRKESEGDEKIQELTESEMPVSGSEIERAGPIRVNRVENGQSGAAIASVAARNPAVEANERKDVNLYDVGVGMGNEREGRRVYYSSSQAVSARSLTSSAPLLSDNRQMQESFISPDRNLSRGGGIDRESYESKSSGENKKKSVGPWE